MAALTVDGATLAVFDEGQGDPPFVFIHGLACDHTFWQPQFDDLKRDHRCVSLDLRGRGASSATPPYHTARQADDVAAVMRALGLGPSVVVGHSLGGITALLLNERHPDLVLAVVLGDSPVRKEGVGAARAAEGLRAAGTTEPLRPLVESFWVDTTPDAVKARVRQVMLGCPAEVAAGMLEDTPDERMPDLVRLADRKPFMALWAEKPLGEPNWLRDVTTFLRQEPVVGAGHFFQLERPEVTNALLRAFLDDVARDPRLAR
jgi:pimeloyl-ACP methyl ester carboxylesterase